jgi:hypothetical protein
LARAGESLEDALEPLYHGADDLVSV